MQSKKSILVIEDDDAARALIVRQLSDEYTVHEACEASTALAMLAKIPQPNAIICDVLMPGMSGLEFARKMKSDRWRRNVPIIFVSACASARNIVDGINAGARNYITKPFKMADLLAKVARAVAD
jgi:CheY-like chemotaxis protein